MLMSFKAVNNINYYAELFKKNGAVDAAIGWNRANKAKRYEMLIKNLLNNNKLGTIIDVGSGFGDLLTYLFEKNIDFNSYIGVEIYKDFYYTSAKKFSEVENVSFRNIDFLDMSASCSNIVGSGIFGYGDGNEGHMYDYFERVINKSMDLADSAFSFNLLSSACDRKIDKNNFFADPEKIASILSKYSRRFLVDHTYSPFEFTITVFKNEDINELLFFCK